MEEARDTDSPESTEVSHSVSLTASSSSRKLSQMSLNLQMPCVCRQLYISGFGGVANQAVMRQRSITHVLNMAHELVEVFPEYEGVVVRHCALRDSENEDLGRALPDLVDYIHDVIRGGGCLVVSCVAGVSRSASVVLAYRVRYDCISLHQAFEELFQVRRTVSPNLGFWRALLEWEEAVTGDTSVVLMPFLCGQVPDLEVYRGYAEVRLKLAFTRELLLTWTLWSLLLALQIVAIIWF